MNADILRSLKSELTPDEYLNCDLKIGVHSGPPARTKDQLHKKALSHLRKLQKLPGRVLKLLQTSENYLCSLIYVFHCRFNNSSIVEFCTEGRVGWKAA